MMCTTTNKENVSYRKFKEIKKKCIQKIAVLSFEGLRAEKLYLLVEPNNIRKHYALQIGGVSPQLKKNQT